MEWKEKKTARHLQMAGQQKFLFPKPLTIARRQLRLFLQNKTDLNSGKIPAF